MRKRSANEAAATKRPTGTEINHVMVMSPQLNRNKNSYRKSKAISIILLYYVKKRRSSENHENFII
ncbi:hypothetical protein ABE61_12640 [Lysinibacillus sphaericus]|nr:hypothetical protein [Lysinibacillus sphaericus]MBG9478291.1 hypothetical protein [Lysinibacillus sphaericus]MBG9591004.1 hypothetical protein [Lysinibacillus sphaericus]